MNTNKKTAMMIGILFIIGTASGMLSNVFMGSIFDDPDYLIKLSTSSSQIIIGVMLVLIMAFALAMIPVVLYPVFRKHNETLALGAVVFRGVLETVTYVGIVISWLLLLSLSREYATSELMEAQNFRVIGTMLQKAAHWNSQMVSIVFSIGALFIYCNFYQSKLIPRWLSVWGLIGALLYIACPIFAMFGLDIMILMAPLALQEMVMALWLIVKGFSPTPKYKTI
jgi:hypothetical protein